jgi:response regulator RpfG family c-di-GMP phosphodiesterase
MTGQNERPRILCVDDEPQVLAGLVDNLRRQFDVHTAPSGADGLEAIERDGPFAVVLTDMRMPGMDGASFLRLARERAPDTVRMLLTGQADLDAAIAAVNEGQLFRFLLKPSTRDALRAAFEAAVSQHELLTAERELLQDTLRGCLETVTDVLSLANPAAFGRAQRLRTLARTLADARAIPDPWFVEIAAMLSQIGCITLPDETAERLYLGKPLTPEEAAIVDRLPAVAVRLLRGIPRIEPVLEIITNARHRADEEAIGGGPVPAGAKILRLVTDFDELEAQGVDPDTSLAMLRGRGGTYDPLLVEKLAALRGATASTIVAELDLDEIEPGMVFADDVRTPAGALLIPRGYEATPQLLDRLANVKRNDWNLRVRVKVDPQRLQGRRAA